MPDHPQIPNDPRFETNKSNLQDEFGVTRCPLVGKTPKRWWKAIDELNIYERQDCANAAIAAWWRYGLQASARNDWSGEAVGKQRMIDWAAWGKGDDE